MGYATVHKVQLSGRHLILPFPYIIYMYIYIYLYMYVCIYVYVCVCMQGFIFLSSLVFIGRP